MPGRLDEEANEVECTYLETASLRGQTQPTAANMPRACV